MIGLVRVELTRLRWRRAILVLLAVAIVVPAVILVVTVLNTRALSFDELVAQQGQMIVDEVERCERRPRQYGVDRSDDVTAACQRMIQGWYDRPPLDLVNEREQGTGVAVILLLAMLMGLIGTTFVGHDWNTGSMSNQFLFEPRRNRVWVGKAIAVLLVTGVVSLAVLVAYWTGLWAVSSARDLVLPENAVEAAYKQAVLGAAFAAGAGVFGYALTMLFRSTVATLGVLFAVALVGGVVLGAFGLSRYERVMPWGNYAAYTVGSYTYFPDSPGCFDVGYDVRLPGTGDVVEEEDEEDCRKRIERSDASIYFGVIFVGVAVPSVFANRRRDVP